MADPILFRPTRQYLQNVVTDDNERRYLEVCANLDMDVWDDNFMGDLFKGGAAPGVYQSTASGANSATAAISTGVVGGAILLDAGDASGGRSDLSLGLHFQGQLNATVYAKVSLNSIAAIKLEVGFTDVVSGTDAGASATKAGNGTWNASDAAILCYDTDDDTKTTLLGVKATSAATSIDLNTTLAASTYYYFGVSLRGDRAKGFILDANGRKIDETTWMETAITATTLLTPWIFVQARAAAAKSATVGRLLVYQRASTG